MIRTRKATYADFMQAMQDCLHIYAKDGLDYDDEKDISLYVDDTLVGIFRGTSIFSGVITVGAILTTAVHKYPKSLIQMCKATLIMLEKSGTHRVQIDVRADYKAGQRFAEALGFKPEGTMKNYGSDKQDYILYARTS